MGDGRRSEASPAPNHCNVGGGGCNQGGMGPDEIPVGECLKYVRELRRGKAKITKKSVHEVIEEIWHPEESRRFAQLAMSYPELLTYEEQVLWDRIEGTPQLWSSDKGGNKNLDFTQLKKYWDQLKQTARDIK